MEIQQHLKIDKDLSLKQILTPELIIFLVLIILLPIFLVFFFNLSTTIIILIIFFILPYLVLYLIYLVNRSIDRLISDNLKDQQINYEEIIKNINPTEAALLINPDVFRTSSQYRYVNEAAALRLILAELMYLAKLGYVELNITYIETLAGKQKKILFKPTSKQFGEELKSYQKLLLNFVKDNLDKGSFDIVKSEEKLEDINKFSKFPFSLISPKKSPFWEFAYKYKKHALKEFQDKYLTITDSEWHRRFIVNYLISFIFTSFILFLISIIISLAILWVYALILLSVCFLNLLIFDQITRIYPASVVIWKPSSKLIRQKILTFKKYIKAQKNVKDIDILNLKEVDDNIIYGLALGEADKLLKSIVGWVSGW
jgi:Ca2+/Na+ antiporter